MGKEQKSILGQMVDLYGYDYVIGYCLCSQYDLQRRADADPKLKRLADKFGRDAERLTRERIENGL